MVIVSIVMFSIGSAKMIFSNTNSFKRFCGHFHRHLRILISIHEYGRRIIILFGLH